MNQSCDILYLKLKEGKIENRKVKRKGRKEKGEGSNERCRREEGFVLPYLSIVGMVLPTSKPPRCCLLGSRVHLVPYTLSHVPKYNSWMKSQTLQDLTGSEPLTLEEEIEMCMDWKRDPNKYTFILLLPRDLPHPASEEDLTDGMVGDVNIFISSDADYDPVTDVTGPERILAEVEVMVAEEGARRGGIAREALGMIMGYVKDHVDVDEFVAKVKLHNEPSRRLFSDKMGFREERIVECFGEVEYRLDPGAVVVDLKAHPFVEKEED